MKSRRLGPARASADVALLLFVPLLAISAVACSGASSKANGRREDDKFAASTNDEYVDALTNAVIGTPVGVIRVGADGGASAPVPPGGPQDAGPLVDAGAVGDDSGVAGGDASSTPEDAGIPVDDGGPVFPPDGALTNSFGQWHFDDCSPESHFLVDSSGGGANAQHELNADCIPGINGLGVMFRTAKDIVQVPDEPQFTVTSNVAVAAWVHPNTVAGDQPIVLKRLNDKTSFSLGIHKGNVEMAVVLANGTTVISRAPIAAGTWSHVAGLYDGTFVFLFIDGQQFGQVFGGSPLRDVFAPIRIGATTQTQHFDGIIDEVFLTMQPVSKDSLTALACFSHPTTLAVSPPTSGPVPFDTTVHYDISVNDNDVGFCPQSSYGIFNNNALDPGFTANFSPSSANATPGNAAMLGADVTASEDADPGLHTVRFDVFRFGQSFEVIPGQLTYDLAAPTGCFVSTRRELMITDPSVVDDPVRTFGVTDPPFGSGGGGGTDASAGSGSSSSGSGGFGGSSGGTFSGGSGGVSFGGPSGAVPVGSNSPASNGSTGSSSGSTGGPPLPGNIADASPPPDSPSLGVWTFGHLLRDLAPTPEDAPLLVEKLFDHWLTDQSVNGFTVSARPTIQPTLLDVWPRTADGALDLDRAPLRLQAIVNRTDLRNLAAGSAGEGRFVFAVNGAGGFPLQFTVILEYKLPAKTAADAATWASLWHDLASHPFPSAEYNAALEALTSRFAGRGASPGDVNGSALINLRTNEIALSNVGRWELREFDLSPTTGFFDEATIKETPDLNFNGSKTFADFVNQNAAAIIAEVPGANNGTVTTQFEGSPFLAGSVFNDLVEWSAPGIVNDDARFHASLNTCNGCHGPEVNTSFLQITPRSPGGEAILSPFLTGTTVTDPSGQTRVLNDLGRRRTDFTGIVCGADAGPPAPSIDAGPLPPPPPSDGGTLPAPTPAVDASTLLE